ncbi:psbP domain-containing protein 6, chloroplastic [Cynara cardunculus var. scolymus]|uniref:Mog1/PsbP, alpha/beta/alpha sandwich n=1 Tax=Cynara cardunculus var. scolymus TaxID=59895 RepID=A0A124SFJ3_CYNCS|nr:psbP domain-containing protein 6, chloroplastic [Cynara cardunculus var. scolymus]KVI03437.1 Mog1/PsbP, alpha/beta/alpha sandwich [Cynara cardunculus var. scolymus]
MASASVSSLSFLFSSSKPASSNKPTFTDSPFLQQSPARRHFLKGLTLSLVPFTTIIPLHSPSPSEAKEIEVGSYLPQSNSDPNFVMFQASSKDTPALRAGNVQPYRFVLPPTWKQLRIANILSGNYCQPKCAEPWIEVKFEDEKQGKVQVVASPLIRLTNKPNATIEDIGSPEKVIASLGSFVTGNTYDSDELLETSIEKIGDQTYYRYLLETPFALTGSHNIAKATAKGNTVILFVASASDKQWPSSQKTLKAIVDSFNV